MHRTIVPAVLTLLCLPLSAGAHPCRIRKAKIQVAVVQAQVIAVPVAVAVGVPVAVYSPYWYAYGTQGLPAGYAQPMQASLERGEAGGGDATEREAAGGLAGDTAAPQASAVGDRPTAEAVFIVRCLKCHSEAVAKGGLSFDGVDPGSLSEEVREKILLRITMSDPKLRMPRGLPPLTGEEWQAMMGELVK